MMSKPADDNSQISEKTEGSDSFDDANEEHEQESKQERNMSKKSVTLEPLAIHPALKRLASEAGPSVFGRSTSIIGRQRKSTFDPGTLKRLKTIKLDALKPDDQIELAILILQKDFEERNTLDINFLVKCTENVDFFKKYDEYTHRQCMAKMYHVHLKEGDKCIEFGEFGETFWVCLKGNVGVVVPIEKDVQDKNGEVRKEKVMTEVLTKAGGYAFGELALVEKKPRAATIYCKEDSEFAVLDKAPFQQILLEKEENRIFAEVNFLKSLEIFSQWAYPSVKGLVYNSELKSIIRNQVIYNQRDRAEHMYIIKHGEFKVSFKARYDNENEEDPNHATIKKYMKRVPPTRDVEVK